MARYLRLDEAASDLAKQLGANCRKRRAELGMTLGELAERTDTAASHLSLIESSKANPTLEVLEKLAAGLDTTVVALLTKQP